MKTPTSALGRPTAGLMSFARPADWSSQPIALPVQRQLHRAHLGEIAHQLGPRHVDLALVQPRQQIDLQTDREEAGDDMPGRGVVPMVTSRNARSTRERLS